MDKGRVRVSGRILSESDLIGQIRSWYTHAIKVKHA